MVQLKKMTDEEKFEMYMQIPHEQLVRMKIEEERVLEEMEKELKTRLGIYSAPTENFVIEEKSASLEKDTLIYKDDNIELHEFDSVQLTNGLNATICGKIYQHEVITEDTPIALMTNPLSSIGSCCYLKHIVKVIKHNGSFQDEMNWWFEGDNLVNQPLHIQLSKE